MKDFANFLKLVNDSYLQEIYEKIYEELDKKNFSTGYEKLAWLVKNGNQKFTISMLEKYHNWLNS